MAERRSGTRLLVRAAGALLFLVVAVLVATALLLPSLLSGDVAARRIRQAALQATGSAVEWRELDVALFPPALTLDGVSARAVELGDAPWLSAERIELRLAWLPLLARTVLVDSLSIEGVELAVRRGPEGWVVPGAQSGGASATGDTGPAGDAAVQDPGFTLALRQVALRRGVLRIDDRSGATPHHIELSELRGDVEASTLQAPIDVALRGTLGKGTVELAGQVSAQRDLEFELGFDGVAMETFAPYLQDALALAGRASGRAKIRGPSANLERVDLTLHSEDAALTSEELSASGPLDLELSIENLERPSGSFSFDATRAVLLYQAKFQKPAGVEATAGGRFRTRPDGTLDVDFDAVRIRDLDARGSFRGGSAPALTLHTEAVALDGWEALVPALAGFRGRAAVPELEVAWPAPGKPPQLRGRARLEDLRVPLPADPERADPERADPERELTLRGDLVADGDVLVSRDLVATFAGQRLPLELQVDGLAATPRWTLRGGLAGADANALASAWVGAADTIYGTLFFDAELGAPAAGDRALLEALGGKIALRIEPGRLRGVSLLRTAIDSLGPVAEAALLAGQLRGGSTLQRFYDDEFTSLTGTFRVRDGRARTEDLQLVYRHYQINLRGDVGLADASLDFSGTLTMFDDERAGVSGAPRIRRVLPLAAVRGTASKPRVAISPGVALSWVAALRDRDDGDDSAGKQSQLEDEIDRRLGKGSGREIFDALEGLLGSGQQR